MRLARAHAVGWGLKHKRQIQQRSGQNFRVGYLNDKPKRPISKRKQSQNLIISSPSSLSAITSGLFQLLVTESPRLQILLNLCKISVNARYYLTHAHPDGIARPRQATEPIFSVSDELVLQNFHSIIREGQDDQALLSAVMLTFEISVTAGSFNKTCLEYQNKALSSIRQRISSLDKATSEPTLGAILLLAGIEVCVTFYSNPCRSVDV
jgi:hypothetical protein